jgi:CBS domain-containing protein
MCNARACADQGIGFLPICDAAGQLIGVVTDRDLAIRPLAKSIDPERTPVSRVMTTPAITCLADSDIAEAEQLMSEEQKSRPVIVESDGRVVGVLRSPIFWSMPPKASAGDGPGGAVARAPGPAREGSRF